LLENSPNDDEVQIKKAGLPTVGQHPFDPQWTTNRKGKRIIEKARVLHGPKRDKYGYLDKQGRIWIWDWGHADKPDHWDVQIDDGKDYFRVDPYGNLVV
jgi:hypothetical protein